MKKYVGLLSEKYSYLVEVEAENEDDAVNFMSEINLNHLKSCKVDFQIEEVKEL